MAGWVGMGSVGRSSCWVLGGAFFSLYFFVSLGMIDSHGKTWNRKGFFFLVVFWVLIGVFGFLETHCRYECIHFTSPLNYVQRSIIDRPSHRQFVTCLKS